MKLQRDTEIIVTDNENTISAFIEAGYVEVKDEEKPKTSPRKTTKAK